MSSPIRISGRLNDLRLTDIHLAGAAATRTRHATHAVATPWFEVRAQDLPLWNDLLLSTDASLYQYPFWNNPQRALGLKPRYVAWGPLHQPNAYACILTAGFGPAKIGLVFRGPISVQAGAGLSQAVVKSLLDWARAEGYLFLRFTHSDPHVLEQLAAAGHAQRIDAFPYFLDYPMLSPDYIVEQKDCAEETLAGFDREVRRKIRRATEQGYEFRVEDSADALAQAWPLYLECARRKHFRLERPLSLYIETIRQAQAHGCVRVYSVRHNGKVVGNAVVLRDRTTAHCWLAAFETDHRQSAVFLHWNAMRDMHRQGAIRYNLGPGPGTLARFKQQFTQTPVSYPGPLTVVLKQNAFKLWWKWIFPTAKRLRPTLIAMMSAVTR
jgi:lipid II:glycine glycyltransferase (peptidoglycan interpeptide bridge formation enzyme)